MGFLDFKKKELVREMTKKVVEFAKNKKYDFILQEIMKRTGNLWRLSIVASMQNILRDIIFQIKKV